jgi:hypothetical protein
MISAQEAFEIASKASLDELAPKAFDCGDCWVFECKDSEVLDPWPAVVDKSNGKCRSMWMLESNKFWREKKSLPTISVKETSEENKDQ